MIGPVPRARLYEWSRRMPDTSVCAVKPHQLGGAVVPARPHQLVTANYLTYDLKTTGSDSTTAVARLGRNTAAPRSSELGNRARNSSNAITDSNRARDCPTQR